MHAERESCFGQRREEAAWILQDFCTHSAEILQHKFNETSDKANRFNGFREIHGRLIVDAHKSTEVLVCLAVENKSEVYNLVGKQPLNKPIPLAPESTTRRPGRERGFIKSDDQAAGCRLSWGSAGAASASPALGSAGSAPVGSHLRSMPVISPVV